MAAGVHARRTRGASSGTSARPTTGIEPGPAQRAREPGQRVVAGRRQRSRARSGATRDGGDEPPVARRHRPPAVVAARCAARARARSRRRGRRPPPRPRPMAAVVARPIAARKAAGERQQREQRAPARLGLGAGRPSDAEAACVHRLRQRHRPLEPAFEHRDDRPEQSAASDGPATGPGEVGLAHRAHRLDGRGDERQRNGHDDTELVERARRRLHQLVVRPQGVGRAEHRHHPDDREARRERLEHDGRLDGAADREAAEHVGHRGVGQA